MAEGIEIRHKRTCRSRSGGRCNCNPSYRASAWSPRDHKLIRQTFPTEAAAKAWRVDALSGLSKGTLRAPKPTTVQQAWDEWYEGAKAGTIRNRAGDPFKPSALRSYERAMRLRVLPKLGRARMADVRRPDLQEFADSLLAGGLDASTINGTLLPLRAIYRRALAKGELAVNPCDGLHLPAVRGRRERYADPQEAERLLATVPECDRAMWATALYAGLRLGELRAVRREDIDLGAGVIRVERGWDECEGVIALKSHAGRRQVPIPAILREYLIAHNAATPSLR